MKKVLLISLAVVLLIILIAIGFILSNMRDRHPDFSLDLLLPDRDQLVEDTILRVGLAKVPITPDVVDTWTDADGNSRYEPGEGDTFTDRNGNGDFDAFWLAGFHNQRPASGVHDDIWARTIVWDDGTTCVAFVVLDAIGFFHDDVLDVREMVAAQNWDIDHVIVASTHNHEVPDLMGLWGAGYLKSGVNDQYRQYVKNQAVKCIGEALSERRPAYLKLSKIDSTAKDLVRDSRPPFVLDDTIYLMQFIDAQSMEPFGLLMNWGDHPETAGSDNLEITADFAHYWLEGIEKGIVYDGVLKEQGSGGIAVFANGAIGGLMTSLGCDIYDPWLEQSFKKSDFNKVRAQGHRLAKLVLDHIQTGEWELIEKASITLAARSFLFDLDNFIFKLGGALGVLDRGFVELNKLRSEVDLMVIGPVWLLTLPGEVNPELVNGGIDVPEGADFPGQPVEIPVFREMMQGKYNFVVGLANDEVGYIMPRTQWDEEEPYTYHYKKRPYGEINSLGPQTGPILHREVKQIISAVQELTD